MYRKVYGIVRRGSQCVRSFYIHLGIFFFSQPKHGAILSRIKQEEKGGEEEEAICLSSIFKGKEQQQQQQ